MIFGDFKAIIGRSFPEITEDKLGKFEALEKVYKEWNSKINVISRKDIDSLYLHHVLHSLAIAYYLRINRPGEYEMLLTGEVDPIKILDLGTGGGFPGIPLAIMFPAVGFVLCDSVGKKIIVASEVSKAVGLTNVRTVNARAESLNESFDYVVSRAVTSMDMFYPWVKGKYKNRVLYLKGGDVSEEIALMMGRNNLRRGSVDIWNVDSWLQDEYFSGKLVLDIHR